MTLYADKRIRTVFGPSLCDVYAYPLAGRFIYKQCTGVELDFLGLSRTDPARRDEDSVKEDAFAFRMLQIGARWWPSVKFCRRHDDAGMQYPCGHHYPPVLHIGYPSAGGVLVLKLFAGNLAMRLEEEDAPEYPGDWSKMGMCYSMDERCKILRGFGAKHFETAEKCNELPNTLDEGIAMGKRYEHLMRKMEDDNYLSDWLDSL